MSLFKELKRRNVIRVAAAYLIIGWLLAQVSATLESALHMPDWFDTMVVTVMLIGFPIALIISWVYELTPDGIKKEKDIKPDDSITSNTGKKLDYITIVAAISVAGMFVWQQMSPADMDSRLSGNDEEGGGSKAVIVNKSDIITNDSVIPAKTQIHANEPDNLNISKTNSKSIAVLPFENRSPDPNDAYFTDGIHDDLLTSISKIGAIKTISRTSVMQYKQTTKTIGQIGKELNVATVLEGGVQRAGNRVRINVQLIDVKTDDHLWAQIYDRELNMDNVFEIQTEIAEEIASALKAQLTPLEKDILLTRPTQNLEAYEAYLLGKQRMAFRQPATMEQAVVLFKKAIELDPKFALAYVGLGDTYLLQPEHAGLDQMASIEKAEKVLNQALKLNGQLGEAYTALGFLKVLQRDFVGAKLVLDKAFELTPNYPTVYHRYGLLFSATGQYELALDMNKKGLQLDPLSAIISSNLSNTYGLLGEQEKAFEQAIKTINIEPNNPIYYVNLARLYLRYTQELDQAVIWLKKAIEKNPNKYSAYLLLVHAYLEMDDEKSAIQTHKQLHDIVPSNLFEYAAQESIVYFQKDENKVRKFAELILQKIPESNLFKWKLIVLDIHSGNIDNIMLKFKKELPQLFQKPPVLNKDNKWMAINLAWVYQQSSQPKKSKQLLDILIDSFNQEEKSMMQHRVMLMKIYSLQGNKKEFLRLFTESLEHPYRINMDYYWFVQKRNPIYKGMMQEPEFLKLKARADKLMADARARLEKHNQTEVEK